MHVTLLSQMEPTALAASLAGLGARVTWITGRAVCDGCARPSEGVELVRLDVSSGETDAFVREIERIWVEKGPEIAADVVHALDEASAAGAAALRAVEPGTRQVRTVGGGGFGFPPPADESVDLWVVNHPLLAERWLGAGRRFGPDCRLVLDEGSLARTGSMGPRHHAVTFWLPRGVEPGTRPLVETVARLRSHHLGLQSTVLGRSHAAERLRDELRAARLLDEEFVGRGDADTSEWNEVVASSSALVVGGSDPLSSEARTIAHAFGVYSVSCEGRDSGWVAQEIEGAFVGRTRSLEMASKLAARVLDPAAQAETLARLYLGLFDEAGVTKGTHAAVVPLLRTRLWVVPLAPHELHATWSVRDSDRRTALQWLGPEAASSRLVLRLADVTDLWFTGANAHGFHDVELGAFEQERTVRLGYSGRSFAPSLGLKGQGGHFQCLAVAPIVHMPREHATHRPADRRLAGLVRRGRR